MFELRWFITWLLSNMYQASEFPRNSLKHCQRLHKTLSATCDTDDPRLALVTSRENTLQELLGVQCLLSSFQLGRRSCLIQTSEPRLTDVCFLKKLLLPNFWKQGLLPSFCCAGSCHTQVAMPWCVWGKIDLWGGEQAAAWVRGSVPTSEWLRIASATGQVTCANPGIQVQ